jgi:hypothetical protein
MWAVAPDSLFVGDELLHVRLQPRGLFWTLMLSGILLFTGLMLVLASRNLRARGTLVYYEGLARLAAAALLLSIGREELGLLAVVIGLADLCLGLGHVLGTPKALGQTHVDMLLDRTL